MYLGITNSICNISISSISRNQGTFLKNSEQISYQKIQIISELLGHVMLQLSRMLVCDVFVIFHVALFQFEFPGHKNSVSIHWLRSI